MSLEEHLAESRPKQEAPAAKREPHVREIHGVRLSDDYHWMQGRNNPEVLAHLERENEFTRQALQLTQPLQNELYREMVGRLKEADVSVPYRKGPYFYYYRTERGCQYAIYCRRRESLDAEEEVLLDLNQLGAGSDYLDLGVFKTSPDHQLLAYSIDLTGSEEYTLFIKDLAGGWLLPDRIERIYDSVEWAADNRTLFYNCLDAAHRPFQLKRHRLGTPSEKDALVYQEDDEAFFIAVSKTRSQDYLLLELDSNRSSEVHYLSAHEPEGEFRVLGPRRPGIEYSVEHGPDGFYVLTNDQALEFRLLKAPVVNVGKGEWTEVIPHRPEVYLEDVLVFRDFMAVFERENGLPGLRIARFSDGHSKVVELEEANCCIAPEANPDFESSRFRFTCSSLTTPETTYDYHVATGQLELLKRDEVGGGFNSKQYHSERIWARAPDETPVPISLVYKKGSQVCDKASPLLLYGYGAYGINVEPSFRRQILSLLDRGVTFALAHVRGGAEMGRWWYESGKLLHKENTFRDFIACAEHLIANGYTSSDRLAIMGGSAGGLLTGVVVNRRPELVSALVARVPFVDVINTMLDRSLPLTVTEYEEWGDPHHEVFFRYMLGYDPYENVSSKPYPAMLVTAGLNDPRVAYWEPAKWVAKIRAHDTGKQLQLLSTDLGAGHSGVAGRYRRLRELAMIYGFIIDRLPGR